MIITNKYQNCYYVVKKKVVIYKTCSKIIFVVMKLKYN